MLLILFSHAAISYEGQEIGGDQEINATATEYIILLILICNQADADESVNKPAQCNLLNSGQEGTGSDS